MPMLRSFPAEWVLETGLGHDVVADISGRDVGSNRLANRLTQISSSGSTRCTSEVLFVLPRRLLQFRPYQCLDEALKAWGTLSSFIFLRGCSWLLKGFFHKEATAAESRSFLPESK